MSGGEPEAVPRRGPLGTADRVALAVATLAGVGYAPLVPGTVGSALTAAVVGAVQPRRPALALAAGLVALAGAWAAGRAERVLGAKDARPIVIDEVAGMAVSALAVPPAPLPLALAFVLFRLFDVTKPFPAHRSQRLPGGLGVMADDLIAGAYALAALAALRVLAEWP